MPGDKNRERVVLQCVTPESVGKYQAYSKAYVRGGPLIRAYNPRVCPSGGPDSRIRPLPDNAAKGIQGGGSTLDRETTVEGSTPIIHSIHL